MYAYPFGFIYRFPVAAVMLVCLAQVYRGFRRFKQSFDPRQDLLACFRRCHNLKTLRIVSQRATRLVTPGLDGNAGLQVFAHLSVGNQITQNTIALVFWKSLDFGNDFGGTHTRNLATVRRTSNL